jgi:twinkle protein
MEHVGIAGTADGAAPSGAKISEKAVAWVAADRRISKATLAKLGVASGTVFFPGLGRKSEALFFRYGTGWARAFPEKAFVSGGGFKQSFWNEPAVLAANPKAVFITEGELDAAALVEAGISHDQVLSAQGAVERKDGDDKPRGYDYVSEALRAGLNRAQRIVWCGDNDGPGLALRSDMVRLFGPAKFWFLEWPPDTKDANDCLRIDGGNFLHGLVTEGAKPWPVEGLYKLSELPEPAPLTLWDPGFPEWESKVRLAPRTLSVVTGHPGHGKTLLCTQIWFNIVRKYDLVAFVASFETGPRPHLRRYLRTFFSGRLEVAMTGEERAKADAWIEDHYRFAVHPERRPHLEWLLERAEVACVRYGVRIIVLDPWNRVEDAAGDGESETKYILRVLRTLHVFANDFNCHVMIVAHPSKMFDKRRGEAPLLEDISGSKHWDNLPDQGFTVYRPELFDGPVRKTETILYHRKARFEELGYACALNLNLDLNTYRFCSTDYEDARL